MATGGARKSAPKPVWDDDGRRQKIYTDDINEAPLPTLAERVRGLRPSHELLEFYRKKIEEFDGEHADMLAKLERYKATFEEQVCVYVCMYVYRFFSPPPPPPPPLSLSLSLGCDVICCACVCDVCVEVCKDKFHSNSVL